MRCRRPSTPRFASSGSATRSPRTSAICRALIATLTEDCVYEIPAWKQRWEGHAGATQFYNGLLTAFPDIHFALTDIVIGPQGVCEEADVTGTHEADWLGFPPSAQRLSWKVVIFFPWDPERRLFRGEKVYTAGLPLSALAF